MNALQKIGSYFFNRPTGRQNHSKMQGGSGTAIFGGYVVSKETDTALSHRERYRTYSQALVNCSIVGAGVRYFLNLCGAAEWTCQPSEADATGEWAARAEKLLFADPKRPWTNVVKRIASYKFYGFSLQEFNTKRAEDGTYTIDDIAPRPAITIENWDREKGVIFGVGQRIPQSSILKYIDRSRLIYAVDDSLSDSPEGLGIFRHLVEPVRRLKRYEQLEAIGFENDLRGIPVGRAPYSELSELDESYEEDIKRAVGPIEEFVTDHIKNPNQGVLLDSAVHTTTDDKGTPSAIYKYDVKLLEGGPTSLPDIFKSIDRVILDIARILGIEIMILGNGEGSFALAKEKASQLSMMLDDTLKQICESVKRDLLMRFWELNGWPMEMMPELTVSAANQITVSEMVEAINGLARSGAMITPDDPINDYVRGKIGAPLFDKMEMELDAGLRGEDDMGAM